MSLNNITGQKYGLIIPGKAKKAAPAVEKPTKSVFAQDSDEEDEEDATFVSFILFQKNPILFRWKR